MAVGKPTHYAWTERRYPASARRDGLTIGYRTPFPRMPGISDSLKLRAALVGVEGLRNKSYGLDVWAPKKVLNVEWDDREKIHVVSYNPGPWEATVLRLANDGRERPD
jgi:hypothetical protein